MRVFFTNSFNNLFAKNFQPLVDKTKLDMSTWSSLPLSLVGRINLVKMVILPKFLYLFQHIPICIKKSFFLILMVFCVHSFGQTSLHALRNQFSSSLSLREDLHFPTSNNIIGLVILIRFSIGTVLSRLMIVPPGFIQRLHQQRNFVFCYLFPTSFSYQ